ncbi:hypothetical protein X777_03848 [Ooceraea biroi]|nr:hypothetical protein X777_03848 [Ooceraea biroi]
MLRRIFAFLILGGLVAVCSCEPVNRTLLLETAGTIKCTDDEGDTSPCRTGQTTIDTSTLEPRENQTRTGRKFERTFLENSDDATSKVSARKKGRQRFGRILLYLLGAMKAALIYGLLHGVAALAGKAVLVAKVALALAIAAIIKKNDHEKVSYEIVKHPHHSHSHTYSSSIDYDHRGDFGDEGYDHRQRRRILPLK